MKFRTLGLVAALAVVAPATALAQSPAPGAAGMPMPAASGMADHMAGHHRHHRHRHHHGCRDPKTMKFESCKTPGAVPVPRASAAAQ